MAQERGAADLPADAVSTRTCSLWMANGILRARFHRGAEVDVADARVNLEVSARLTSGQSARALIDMRLVKSQTSEARALFSGPAAARVAWAVALVVDSPLSRVLGNFYLRFNRPEALTRLFSSEVEAERWLLEVTPREGLSRPTDAAR